MLSSQGLSEIVVLLFWPRDELHASSIHRAQPLHLLQ